MIVQRFHNFCLRETPNCYSTVTATWWTATCWQICWIFKTWEVPKQVTKSQNTDCHFDSMSRHNLCRNLLAPNILQDVEKTKCMNSTTSLSSQLYLNLFCVKTKMSTCFLNPCNRVFSPIDSLLSKIFFCNFFDIP